MSCPWCGRDGRCRHQDEGHVEQPVRRQPVPQPVPQLLAPLEEASLFEPTGLADLRCVICGRTIPSGLLQHAQRHAHGRLHESQGEARSVRRGMPAGVVRFLVVKS